MQLFRRIGATILVVIVLVSITASCFATSVTVTGIDFFTAAFQTFIEICGLTTVLTSNGVNSSSNDPYSQIQLTDQYQNLYDEYQATLPSQESISDWYDTYKDSVILNIDSNQSIISPTIDAQLSEWFSGFAGWILEDKYNCTRTDSGFSHSSGTFDSPLELSSTFSYPGGNMMMLSNGYYFANVSTYDWYLECVGNVYAGKNGYNLCIISPVSQTAYVYYVRNNSIHRDYAINCNTLITLDGVSYYYGSKNISYSGIIANIPVLTYFPPVITDEVVSNSESISLRPKDKYNEDAIPVPNVESNTYVPEALEGEYSDVITGALEGIANPTLDDVMQAVLDAVTENSEVIAEERVDPAPVNPVMPPFMPFDLPSFDFNLSGIWYYVVRWVNSISSGATLLFSVFNNIPAAMFYPVFGSAVVVIVIGVWKRFIA